MSVRYLPRAIAVAIFIAGLTTAPIPAFAGGQDEDIKISVKILNDKAGETGMTEADRKKYEEALTKYGEERSKMMEEMIASLARFDNSGIRSIWETDAKKGKDFLDKLDNVGTVRVPTHALISLIDVEQSKWTGI